MQVNAPSSGQANDEHVFLLRIERIKGLTPLQSTVWGEADCYIQYTFPTQEEASQDSDPHILESRKFLLFINCNEHLLILGLILEYQLFKFFIIFYFFIFLTKHNILSSHSDIQLKSYRTATTLCMPDPVFGHCETHVLVASPGVPVQRLLLSSLASQGYSNGGGIQFEVWCR